jgi:hypothetical protein
MRIHIWVVLITAYALGLGVLGGMALERFRFDRDRAVVLRQYEEETARVRRWRMAFEANTASGHALPAPPLPEKEVHSDEQPFRSFSRPHDR